MTLTPWLLQSQYYFQRLLASCIWESKERCQETNIPAITMTFFLVTAAMFFYRVMKTRRRTEVVYILGWVCIKIDIICFSWWSGYCAIIRHDIMFCWFIGTRNKYRTLNDRIRERQGAPARDSRTGTWLVSPAAGHEKKKRTPPEQSLRLPIWVCQNLLLLNVKSATRPDRTSKQRCSHQCAKHTNC